MTSVRVRFRVMRIGGVSSWPGLSISSMRLGIGIGEASNFSACSVRGLGVGGVKQVFGTAGLGSRGVGE